MNMEKKFAEVMTDEKRDAFKKKLGFYIENVFEIGFDKYSNAMGWTDESQLLSWETDSVSTIICPACQDNFGPWELDFGLCSHCVKDFYPTKVEALRDIENIARAMLSVEEKVGIQEAFYLSQAIREQFRRRDNSISDMESSELLGYAVISDALLYIMAGSKMTDSLKLVEGKLLSKELKGGKTIGDTKLRDVVLDISKSIMSNDKIKLIHTPHGATKPANAWIYGIYLADKVSNAIAMALKEEVGGEK